jgi:hypothetical protein
MVLIGNVLVSLDVFEQKFLCNLGRCRGMCCVEGVAGAPVEKNEEALLSHIMLKVKPYLRPEGWKAIQQKGPAIRGNDGELETPLVNGEECAYAIFENGIAKCAIEKAYFDNEVSFRKPISCHLYPIRIRKMDGLEALNYHVWDICRSAVRKGKKEDVPVYKFVKDALIRRYGEQWYGELEETAEAYYEKQSR